MQMFHGNILNLSTGWGKFLLCQRALCHHDVVTHNCVVRGRYVKHCLSGLDLKDFTSHLV